MLWIILAIIAALLSGISAFLDNYTTDVIFNKKLPQATKVLDGPFYLAVALLIFIFCGGANFPPLFPSLMIFLSGAILALASIPYYYALKNEETTAVSILFQLAPIFYLILGWIFLKDNISPLQLLGFFVTMLAPVVIALSKRKRGRKAEYKTIILMLLFVSICAVGNTIFVGFGSDYDLWPALCLFVAGKGTFDVVTSLCFKKWRVHYGRRIKKLGWKGWLPILINQTIWQAGDFIYRAATFMAPIALVTVLYDSGELILVFILGIILTVLWPKFGREKLDKRTIGAHFLALIFAVIGIILIK